MMKTRLLHSCAAWGGELRRLFFVALFSVLALSAAAQGNSIKGNVVDESGQPVIGASVLIQGTLNGTNTDIDGNFSLNNVPTNATIEVSYIGYKTAEVVAVPSQTFFKISLKEDSATLDEVVVVGYGVQKKSDVTGSVASVSAEQLTARPVNNAFEAMQGKAAGVDITSNERPGEIGSIRIRGTRSLTATNDPLYVVDGVPLMSKSAIETINPRDIKSIDILKDASATAIYGSRGANGVVIVTTKQGEPGRFTLNYSGTVTISSIVDKAPTMSAADFIQYRRWAAYNLDPETYAHPDSPTRENDMLLFDSSADGQTSRDNVMRGWSGGTWDPSKVQNTNWTDFVTQTSVSHEHTLSASGGTDKMSAYGSFGYLSNKGTQKGQWYDRYTGKLSVNITPVKWFNLTSSLNATYTERDFGMSTYGPNSNNSTPNAIYGKAKLIYNHAVPYDDEGNLVYLPGGESAMQTPIDEWKHSTQQSEMTRILANFAATFNFGEMWEPLKGLSYKIAFGPDFRYWREGTFLDGKSARARNPSTGAEGYNQARMEDRRDFSWTLDNMITYNRTFNKHTVGATFLQTASAWNYVTAMISASHIPDDMFKWNAFNTTNNSPKLDENSVSFSTGLTERQLASYMIRLNYGFDERYLVTVSGRWDGASQLAPGHKWDFFPSAALAWRINQEEFLKQTDWLDNLKLRLGYGVTGNAGVSPYGTTGKIQSMLLPFPTYDGGLLGYATNEPYYTGTQLAMANPELGWEKTAQWNIGVDFGFWGSRLFGSLEVYFSKTTDLLMDMNIPTLTGFPKTTANVGSTKNRGVEITLTGLPVQTRSGFTWESTINAAWQKNEIVELATGKQDDINNKWFIGKSIGVVDYGYKHEGLWQDTPEDHAEMVKWAEKGYHFEPGNVRPHDTNGDYIMDESDRVILGYNTPRWTLGWTNTFTYKGLELTFSMYGRMGYTVNVGGQAFTGHENPINVSYWTPDHTDAEFQKPILAMVTSGSQDQFSGLLGYKKASFIKMRNISLGYTLPKKLLAGAGISNLKVYAQVLNPFDVYSSVKWYDFDTNKTYFNRSFVFGVDLTF